MNYFPPFFHPPSTSFFNTDESLTHSVDPGGLFGHGWNVASVQETTPDFLVTVSTKSSRGHMYQGITVVLAPLSLRSFVVTLNWIL